MHSGDPEDPSNGPATRWRRRRSGRAGLPRDPRRRRPRLHARPAPRAAGRRARLDRLLPRALRRGAALPGAPRPRAPHPARRVPRRARRHGHVRLRVDPPPRRAGRAGQGRPRARRDRPPRLQRPLRHDQRGRPRGRRLGRRGLPPHRALGLPLTRDVAICLYAGLVCDTGRFQYESTTPEVFALAGRLLEFDAADRPAIRCLFEEHRFAYLRLSARCWAGPSCDTEKSFVWAAVTAVRPGRHGVTFEETEGLIDFLRRTTRGRGLLRAQGGDRRHLAGQPPLGRRRRRLRGGRRPTAAAATASPPASPRGPGAERSWRASPSVAA